MAKGYWIAHVTVSDPDQYKHYVEGSAIAFKKYGANMLARGGDATQLEGDGRPRNVALALEVFGEPRGLRPRHRGLAHVYVW